MCAVISFLTRSSDSRGVHGRAVMAAVTPPALSDGRVAGVRTVRPLWTASHVKSSSVGAVESCRTQRKTKENAEKAIGYNLIEEERHASAILNFV